MTNYYSHEVKKMLGNGKYSEEEVRRLTNTIEEEL